MPNQDDWNLVEVFGDDPWNMGGSYIGCFAVHGVGRLGIHMEDEGGVRVRIDAPGRSDLLPRLVNPEDLLPWRQTEYGYTCLAPRFEPAIITLLHVAMTGIWFGELPVYVNKNMPLEIVYLLLKAKSSVLAEKLRRQAVCLLEGHAENCLEATFGTEPRQLDEKSEKVPG